MASNKIDLQGEVKSNGFESLLRQLSEHRVYGVVHLAGSDKSPLTFVDGRLAVSEQVGPSDQISDRANLASLLHSLLDGEGFNGHYEIQPIVGDSGAHTRRRYDPMALLNEEDGRAATSTVTSTAKSAAALSATPAAASTGTATKTSTSGASSTSTSDSRSSSGSTEHAEESAPEKPEAEKTKRAIAADVDETAHRRFTQRLEGRGTAQPQRSTTSEPVVGGRRKSDPLTERRMMNPDRPGHPLRSSQLRETLLSQPMTGKGSTLPSSRPPTPADGDQAKPKRPARPAPTSAPSRGPSQDRTVNRSASTSPSPNGGDKTTKPAAAKTSGPAAEATDAPSGDNDEGQQTGPPSRRRALSRLIRALAS